MITVTSDTLSTFRQTNQLICAEALRRGFRVTVPVLGSPLITIEPGDTRQPLHIFSATPPTTSFAAAAQADNKFASYQAFKAANLPVFPTILVQKANEDQAIEEALKWGAVIAVKPLDAAHGDGVTVGVKDKEGLKIALTKAYEASSSADKALLQPVYTNPVDLRILCIDYTFVAAVRRIPARVVGDGTHTIQQLITIENSQHYRGERYIARLATIDVNEARAHLSDDTFTNYIPQLGEEISVLGKANYGSGGETENITELLPAWLIEIAEQAAKAANLPLCGIDIFVASPPHPVSTIEELNPIVNEVNKCPSLYIHQHPTNNEGTPVTEVFIEYLLSL